MQQKWKNDNCEAMKAHYAVYSIPKAAALWCGVPENQIEKILKEATQIHPTGLGRCIWEHPDVPCLEYRSRAIAEATEDGSLLHGREDGEPISGEHVAYERRHIFGRNLRKWIEEKFPNDKPAFLFDDIERSTHTSISADAYRALKAEHDKLDKRLENAKSEYIKLREEKDAIKDERDSLLATVAKSGLPGDRAETTYQNIIAALLDCIAGNLPGAEKHPSFPSEAKLIEAIDQHFDGYSGLSKSNLSRKFPEAKRALQSQ
ncbi:MAG: hypothetical protein RAP03_10065 [Candidatus Electryonea clarkiae]|jgi:hypothetical protein|nr:hypothetical protein [Candidatus Electryonea clarkiae]